MFTSDHTATHAAVAGQSGAPVLEQDVPVQSVAAARNHLTNANALLVNLLAASPARARSFAISLHERLCERGDFEHANVREVVLQLCRHRTPANDT